MLVNSKFVGVVTSVIDENSFIFGSDNNVVNQIGQIVGLRISDDTYMIASIEEIEVNFFLNNTQEYFTTLASENKLYELTNGVRLPKYSQSIKANFIGKYKFDVIDNHFVESKFSINTYTPNIFHKVEIFDFEYIETVYGLRLQTDTSIKLGQFLYPNYLNNKFLQDVNVSTNTFSCHTLISGVTGSGKTMLSALIANQIALNGGHVTIIDPHSEYVNFAPTNNVKLSIFSHKLNLNQDEINNLNRPLSLTNDYLTPQVLEQLLPNLSDQQYEYLCKTFDEIKNSKNKCISLKNIIEITIKRFSSDFQEEGHLQDLLINAQKAASVEVNYLPYVKNLIKFLNKEWYGGKSKPAKSEVAFTLLKRLIDIYEEEIFNNDPRIPNQSWLDFDKRNSINIMEVVYDSNTNNRRIVNTIIQCFFTPQNKSRILIVDEAHLLLNEKTEFLKTSTLLSRLLRESRKFNLSIIFITQNENDVPTEIKSQFQNEFKFREENNQKLKYLANQSCLCKIFKGKLSFPMRVSNVEKLNIV